MIRLAQCTANENRERNLRRNLPRIVSKHGRQLDIKISSVPCKAKVFKNGKTRIQTVKWPVMHMSQWLECMLSRGGELILAGHHVSKVDCWQEVFSQFWDSYQQVDPSHPVFHEVPKELRGTYLPLTLHGDEGRGRNKDPVLIESFVPVISHKGIQFTNISG